MKILHCAETIKGGVATVLKQIAEAQIQSSECERLICLIPESQRKELDNIDDENVSTYHRSGRNITSFLNFIKAFIRLVRTENPDIVHLHSTFAGVLARLVILLTFSKNKPKIVYCPHAFSFLMESSCYKKNLYIAIEKFFSVVTDCIICVSDYERRAAIDCGMNEKKLVVIHNGVPERKPRLRQRGFDNRAIQLLFVGRFDFQKGYDLLVSAMKDLNNANFHLIIVGDSVNEDVKRITLSNVTYTGWLTSQEVESYFLNSDVLIIPSRWEGFAMVPLEAMSYSLPIVSSDSTSLPEVVLDKKTGLLFKNGDAEDLKNKIISLQNLDLFAMGEEGNKLFMTSFTAKAMIEKTALIYHQLGVY